MLVFLLTYDLQFEYLSYKTKTRLDIISRLLRELVLKHGLLCALQAMNIFGALMNPPAADGRGAAQNARPAQPRVRAR